MTERKWKAEEVERDPISKKVLWVRIQYFKNGELLHDVRFVPIRLKNGKKWVRIEEPRIIGGFIPKNRYAPMAKKAYAIIYDKHVKQPEQLDFPI